MVNLRQSVNKGEKLMSHYVLSDVHGDARRFHRMLENIRFSTNDTLYIIGDIVDRGPEPVELLLEIMDAPNMVMLMGNHEHMCMRYYAPDCTEREIYRWNLNNNTPTKQGIEALPDEKRRKVLQFLAELPVHLEVTVNGRSFYLVHGFPAEDPFRAVWDRPEPDTPNPVPGHTLIVGHTPICCIGRDEAQEAAYCRDLEREGRHMTVYHGAGFIDIDCGCGYPIACSALACLRLEDMKEFYIF